MMTLEKAIQAVIGKHVGDVDQATRAALAAELEGLFREHMERAVNHSLEHYQSVVERHFEPGSDMDRKLKGEIPEMEQALMANLGSMR
ncbi:MAG: hypothetical protein ACPGU7_02110 [Gammaproteobacteria bacterium]